MEAADSTGRGDSSNVGPLLGVPECREQVRSHFMEGGVFVPPTPHRMLAPASNTISAHYSFDFVSNPLQPGPIYFLTPGKAAIFGACCEAIPRQVNFIIYTGKGTNTVVSLWTFFLPSWPR